MTTRIFVSVLIVLLIPSSVFAASPADSAQARYYLRSAIRHCLLIQPQKPEYDNIRPGVEPPPLLTLRNLNARRRLDLWIMLIGLQWRSGDTLEAERNARNVLYWGRQNGRLEDIRGALIEQLQAARSDLAVQLIFERLSDHRKVRADSLVLWQVETASALTRSLGVYRAAAYLKFHLPDSTFQKHLPGVCHQGASFATWSEIQKLSSQIVDDGARNSVLYGFALEKCRAHDLRSAMAAAAHLPEMYDGKAIVLAHIARELCRVGSDDRARAFADRARRLSRREGAWPSVSEAIAWTYVRTGGVKRAESFLKERPDKVVQLEIVGAILRSGESDSALALLVNVKQLRGFLDMGNVDHDIPQWIGAMADSGYDEFALQAVKVLRYGQNRGWALSLIATSQARRGHLAAAEQTIASITQAPHGLAQVLAAMAGAYALSGDFDKAMLTVDRMAPEVESQCRTPIDYAPAICGHPVPCPPLDGLFNARMAALLAIGTAAKNSGRLDELVEVECPVGATTLLLGAATALLSR